MCDFVGSTPSIPECFLDGQVRLANNNTGNSTEYEEISGILEICVDGSYERVCGNDDASLNASMLVETACNDIGYGGVVYICSFIFYSIILLMVPPCISSWLLLLLVKHYQSFYYKLCILSQLLIYLDPVQLFHNR